MAKAIKNARRSNKDARYIPPMTVAQFNADLANEVIKGNEKTSSTAKRIRDGLLVALNDRPRMEAWAQYGKAFQMPDKGLSKEQKAQKDAAVDFFAGIFECRDPEKGTVESQEQKEDRNTRRRNAFASVDFILTLHNEFLLDAFVFQKDTGHDFLSLDNTLAKRIIDKKEWANDRNWVRTFGIQIVERRSNVVGRVSWDELLRFTMPDTRDSGGAAKRANVNMDDPAVAFAQFGTKVKALPKTDSEGKMNTKNIRLAIAGAYDALEFALNMPNTADIWEQMKALFAALEKRGYGMVKAKPTVKVDMPNNVVPIKATPPQAVTPESVKALPPGKPQRKANGKRK